MDRLQCEGLSIHRKGRALSAAGTGLVAKGVTLPISVGVENRLPHSLTLNKATPVKPQPFPWSSARTSNGFMTKMP
jgi:hypothetical protein